MSAFMRRILYVFLVGTVLVSTFSCKKGNNSEEGDYLGQFEVEDVTESEGLVTYFAGTVFLTAGGERSPLTIGAYVKPGDTVETETESFCEIQFGENSVIRIDQSSVVEISSLFDSPDKKETGLTLAKGSLICKVEKLLNKNDSFKVKTDTAVCGVRGTQFSVSKESGEMVLSVKEGRVAVSSPKVDELSEALKKESGNEEFVQMLEESSVSVGVSEEVAVADDAFDVSDTQAEKALSLIEKDNADIEQALTSVNAGFRTDSNVVKEKKGSLSEKSVAKLEQTDDMKIVALKDISEKKKEFYKIGFTVEPKEASVVVNGYNMGSSFSRVYEAGDKLVVEISCEGFESQTKEIVVSDEMAKLFKVTLDPVKESGEKGEAVEASVKTDNERVTLNLTLTPQDAQISIDGQNVGVGSFSGEFDNGTSLQVKFTRPGYKTEERTISVGDGNGNLSIDLQPQPIEKRFAVSNLRGVGELSVAGSVISYVDAGGVIHGVNIENGTQFNVNTANVPNENTPLVQYGNYLYFSGVAELIVANAGTGGVLSRVPLSADMIHIFGRRPTPAGTVLLYPGNENLHIMDLNGNPTNVVSIPGGSKMSAAVWNGNAVIGDQAGNMLIINIASGEITATIPTNATQGLAIAPAIYGNIAVMSGRHGVVTAVDLVNQTVLWDVNIGGLGYDSISVGASGCYIFMGNSIIGLSWGGGYLFPAIAGASCAPLVYNEKLYYGTANGKFVVADAGTGRALRTTTLGVPADCRPVALPGNMIGVKAGAEVMVINPEGMVE